MGNSRGGQASASWGLWSQLEKGWPRARWHSHSGSGACCPTFNSSQSLVLLFVGTKRRERDQGGGLFEGLNQSQLG